MPENRITSRTLAHRVEDRSISGRSMVVTVFGDSVSQHGGWIWLGSLIEALKPLGFRERSVRTAVYRLTKQNWLKADQVGRRRFFCFTDDAQAHYARAARRIYAAGHKEWDGRWTLVLPSAVPEEKRDKFVRSLSWQGFSSLAPGTYGRPSADRGDLDEAIDELDLDGSVVVLQASTGDPESQKALKQLAQAKWNLDRLHDLYDEFLDFYRPLTRKLAPQELTPRASFCLRTLMVHDYRRVLLKDPEFPDVVLPTGWIGFSAYELIKRSYRLLAPASEEYVRQNLENADGLLPGAGPFFHSRFGGLDPAA